MEKLKINLKNAINFKIHIQLCRLCLNKFNANEKRVKITKEIRNQYFLLTQFDLNFSSVYSNIICSKCHHFLNEFTILKQDWTYKQSCLEKYVENPVVTITDDEEDVKTELIKVEPEIDSDYDDFQPISSDDDELMIKKEVKNEKPPSPPPYIETLKNKIEQKTRKRRDRSKVERKFKCKLCSTSFQREQTLENHQMYQHPETLTAEEIKAIKEKGRVNRMRLCPECGIATDQLKQHILYVHQQVKRFFCDYCSYATFKKFNIRSHVLRHITLEKKFTCHICGKKFSRKSAFNSHMRDFHENSGRKYVCHCGREFNTNGKLYKHKKWKHEEDAKVPCPHCNKDIMKEGLAEHMRVDPEDKFNSYVCNECGKDFPNKRCLNHHRTLHQERNFICDFQDCNRAFLSLAQLQSHQKWHLNPKNYKCPYEGCDKNYAKQQGLKVHIAIKHENYRKKCPIQNCTYETGIFQDMRGHVRRHKELKPEAQDDYIVAIRKLNLL